MSLTNCPEVRPRRVSPPLIALSALLAGCVTAGAAGTLPTGYANSVVVSPFSSSVVYAATAGGLFRSTDGGTSWARMPISVYAYNATAMALDPGNPSRLYAATSNGVFATADGGQTWSWRPGCANVIALDPMNPGTLYTDSCGYGIYSSSDYGQTWTSHAFSDGVYSIAVQPGHPATVVAATSTGVFVSTNAGQSWTATLSAGSGYSPRGLQFDPLNSSRVLLGTSSGIYVSLDAGQTWAAEAGPIIAAQSLAFDPQNGSTVYASTGPRSYKSTDGGRTWAALSANPPFFVTGIAVDPAHSCTLFAATTNETVYKSANCGNTWSAANSGIIAFAISGVTVDPQNSSAVYLNNRSSGVFKSTDGGSTWAAFSPIQAGAGVFPGVTVDPSNSSRVYSGTVALDPNTPSTVYASGYGAVLKSTNSGTSWTSYSSGLPSSTVQSLAVNPQNSQQVYAGTWGSGAYVSVDGGQHWSALNNGLTSSYVYQLAFDRNVTPNLWAAADGLFKLPVNGTTWTAVSGTSCGPYNCYGVAFDPTHPSIMYAAGFTGIGKSLDGGQSWTVKNSGLQYFYTQALAVDPSNPSTIYAAMQGGGLYKSTDSAASWQLVGFGTLPSGSAVITSSPAGASFSVSGPGCAAGTYTTPTRLNWMTAAQCQISFASPQTIGSAQYSYVASSISGAGVSATNPLSVTASSSAVSIGAVFTTPGCSYSFSPGGSSYPWNGGGGAFSMATGPTCGWIAATSSPWITVLPGATQGSGTVSFIVAANNGAARNGSITAGGRTFTVSQAGNSCSFAIGPGSSVFPLSGGLARITVTAPPGCGWTAVSGAPWLAVTQGASGSGNGSVTVSASPGSTARTGTVLIAGQSFTATQGSGACGALDLTSVLSISAPAPRWNAPFLNQYFQTVTITNHTASTVSGPLYVVITGLPSGRAGLLSGAPLTHCFSSGGDYLILLGVSSLNPGQSTVFTPLFVFPSGWPAYSYKVLSGAPSN